MLVGLVLLVFLLLTDVGKYATIVIVGTSISIVLGLSTTLVGAVLAGWMLSKLLF